MPTPQPPLPKKEVALALLERSNDSGIFVHLDPRRAGVTVPPWFKKQPQLVLQIGLNMAIPIPDLRLDDEGMTCTLSFSGSPFYCVVPWASVFAIVGDDARGMVWPDDVPIEISRQAPARPAEAAPRKDGARLEPAPDPKVDAPSKGKRPRKRPSLAAVSDEAPPAPPSRPAKPARAPQVAQSPPATPSTPAVPSAPASKPSLGAPTRKKRELPPYLRVVK
jgi:stringent starvation protein B